MSGHAARQYQVVERLDLADFGGHQLGCAAGLFDGLPRLGEFNLLDAFGCDEERNFLAVQCRCHEFLPLLRCYLSQRVPGAAGSQSGRFHRYTRTRNRAFTDELRAGEHEQRTTEHDCVAGLAPHSPDRSEEPEGLDLRRDPGPYRR